MTTFKKCFLKFKTKKFTICCIIFFLVLFIISKIFPVLYWFFHDSRLDYCLDFSECKDEFYLLIDYLDNNYSLNCDKNFYINYNSENKLYTLCDLESKETIFLPDHINTAFIRIENACQNAYSFSDIDISNGVVEFKVEARPYWFVFSPASRPKYEKDCLIKKADTNFYHVCFG